MKTIYIIDANALIDASKYYNMKKSTFAPDRFPRYNSVSGIKRESGENPEQSCCCEALFQHFDKYS